MVGFYDITGFHTTGRQRLTQGLMAGHMRSQRTSIFPSKTVINNNIFTGGYADYGCYSNSYCENSTPKWMTWLMGGGMIAGVLGGIFGANKTEGAGGGSDKPATDKPPVDNSNLKADIKALEKQYPDATFSILSDGSIMCDQEKYESLDEVINALKKNYPKTPEKKDKTTTDNSVKTQADPNLVKNKTDGGKTTTDNGKLTTTANNDGKTEVTAPEVNTDPVVNAANVHKTTGVVKKTKNTGSSPAGWYKASADLNPLMQQALMPEVMQSITKKNKTSAAHYILDMVLYTKGNNAKVLTSDNKAKLLNEIIKKNPSVFNNEGGLKKDADLSKLDIPSEEWIRKFCGVKTITKNGKALVVKNKQNEQEVYTETARNGYQARYNKKSKKWTYHKPDGTQISPEEFRKVNPKMAANIDSWNKKHNASNA